MCNDLQIWSICSYMKRTECYGSVKLYFIGVYLYLFSLSVPCWYFPWNSFSTVKQRQFMKGLCKKSYICKYFDL